MSTIQMNNTLTTEELHDLATMLPRGRIGYRTLRVNGQHFAQWPDGLVTVHGRFQRIDGDELTADDNTFIRELYGLLKMNREGERAA